VRPEGAKFVVDTVPPYRIVLTFAIAALLAPNDERSEVIELICVLVRPDIITVNGTRLLRPL
jgi:hypothetical protein